MGLAVLLAREALVAHRTLVGLLARMRAHVDVQVAAERKLLAAGRARETGALRVDPHVTLQVRQARETLVALFAPVTAISSASSARCSGCSARSAGSVAAN